MQEIRGKRVAAWTGAGGVRMEITEVLETVKILNM